MSEIDQYCEKNVREIDHFGELHIRDEHQILVIDIPKALTAVEAVSFVSTIKSVLESSSGVEEMDLDFSRTEFVDSSGIGALANIIKMAKISGQRVSISGATATVQSVLKMTNLDQLVQMKLI